MSSRALAKRAVLVMQAEQDRVTGNLSLQVAGRALGDDPTVVHDHQAIAEHVGFLQVVGGEEDRRAAGPQRPDVIPEIGPILRVEPRARLVEEQHLGLVHDPERDVEPPPLPAGISSHPAVRELVEVEDLHQLLRP